MIKYEIYKDCFEVKKGNRLWFPKDMSEAYGVRDNDFQVIKSFDNLKDAEEFFEKEKSECCSRYQATNTYTVVLFDVIELRATEYDEENEFQSDEIYDWYIDPINHSVDDVVDYVCSNASPYDTPDDIKKFITDKFTNICDSDLNEVMEELSDDFFED